MTRRGAAAVAATVLAATATLLTAGCSVERSEAGPGVTATTIRLGVLSDHSGPFASMGRAMAQGRQLYWDGRNGGKVCGRTVAFEVVDHGYDTARAVTAYGELRGKVLAMDELLGSPMIGALLPRLAQDRMVTLAGSFSSHLLSNPYVVVTGATYDVEMINGIQWLGENKGLRPGAKVAHVLIDGDYGGSALAGSRAAAKEFGLELTEYRVTAAEPDLSGVMARVRASGARHVLLTTTPQQTASAVTTAERLGHDAFFVGSSPAFNPALLAGPARTALERRLVIATSVAPFTAAGSGPTAVREAFIAKYPAQPRTSWVMFGYAQGLVMGELLDAACRAGDLTRAGLSKALRKLWLVDPRQLVPPLSYDEPGEIPARESYLTRPDARVDGGLLVVGEMSAAPLARVYRTPG
jgi:ABC-type branched-subunit amino acid transport system substrate-binding protein